MQLYIEIRTKRRENMQSINRISVSAPDHNRELTEAKRNQYTQDKGSKGKVICALLHAHTQLCKGFTIPFKNMNNLSLTTQVTSVLQTIPTILRQTGNTNSNGKVE